MKKKKFGNNLKLNKSVISNFKVSQIRGGGGGTLLEDRCDSEDQCLSYYEAGDCGNPDTWGPSIGGTAASVCGCVELSQHTCQWMTVPNCGS